MFRWDDAEAFDDAVVELGNEAYGALCRARKHCAHKLTDGVLSRALALLIAPEAVWERTASFRLADESPRFIEFVGNGAIRCVGFATWNRTAAEATELREKRAEAGKAGGSQSGKHRAAAKATPERPPEQPAKQVLEQVLSKKEANMPAEVQQSGTGSGSGSDLEEGSPRETNPDPHRAEEIAIALQMRQHEIYRPLDAHRLAPMLWHRAWQWKKKLPDVLAAIDDLALKKEGLGLTPEALQGKLVGFIRNAKEPKKDEKPPGVRYRDFKPDKVIPIDPLKQAELAAKVAGIGKGGT